MSVIEYLRIYNDADECSHFDIQKVGLNNADDAPPTLPLMTSSMKTAEKFVFLKLPVGWHGDWHPTPIRQWLILLSGELEFEVGDGKQFRRKTGDVVMLDDVMGKGHQTKVVGNIPVRIVTIHSP